MLKNNKNKIFAVFILLSVVFSFYFVNGRLKAERDYKNYEVCADYDTFSRMAYSRNENPNEYFKQLAQNGVTTVTINESTINSMKKDPNSNVKTYLDGKDLVVEGNKDDLDFIKEGLKSLKINRNIEDIAPDKIKIQGYPQDVVYFKSDAYDVSANRVGDDGNRSSVLEYIGLGFDGRKIENLKDIDNLQINLRPSYLEEFQNASYCMNRFFDAVDKYSKNQGYVVFNGKEFYKDGNDPKLNDEFINNLNKRNLAIGLIESSNQRGHLKLDGIDPVAKNDKVRKMRVFSTWDYIQSEFDYSIPGHHNGEELTNVYYRAISERNVSAVIVNPFVKNEKMLSDPKIYGKVLGNLESRLAEKGYKVGDTKPIGEWNVNNKMKFPVALGTSAAAVILLGLVFGISSNAQIILFILGALLSAFFFILGKKEDFGSVLFNLVAIVTYPSLAVCTVMENLNKVKSFKSDSKISKIFVNGLLVLLCAVIISMIGALMEISYMSGTNYLVELNIFRGVKISQLLPIVMSLFIFASYVGFYRKTIEKPGIRCNEIRNVLDENVKFWQAGLGAVVLVILALFIIRGGNTSAKVPGMELLFRNMLEKYLYARPRTKALFIGFPAVFLLIYLGYKKRGEFLLLILTIFVAIGQADIVNTFSHIRTPLTMSIARVIIEFVGAAIIGLVLILVAQLILKGYDRYIAKKL